MPKKTVAIIYLMFFLVLLVGGSWGFFFGNYINQEPIANQDNIAMEDNFVVGETLHNPYGNNFKMPFKNKKDGETYFATITALTATKEKEADINNIEDYNEHYAFYRYIYKVKITGNVDKELAIKTLRITCSLGCSGFTYSVDAAVDSGGSFQGEVLVRIDSNENVIIPRQVTIYS